MGCFDKAHPAAAAFCLLSVLIISVFTASPILQLLSLAGGTAFYILLNDSNLKLRNAMWDILLFAVIVVTNPLFVHNGATPLLFINGTAVTLEALLCGISIAATMLAAVFWFRCFNIIMTSDKLLFLFSEISPKVSLVFSAAMRFVPLFKLYARKIRNAQKTMCLYDSDSLTARIRAELRVFSSLISLALETAVDTGESMKGRGYGLRKRTFFSVYRFSGYDKAIVMITAILDTAVISATVCGRLDFSFYPRIAAGKNDIWSAAAIAAFAALAFLPFISEIKEDILWRCYRSKI